MFPALSVIMLPVGTFGVGIVGAGFGASDMSFHRKLAFSAAALNAVFVAYP